MKIKVKDFLIKWSGEIIIEDTDGAIYTEFRENLNETILNANIVNIKLDNSMWTDKAGTIIIVVEL